MGNKLKVAVFNTQPPHLYYGGVESRIVETSKVLSNKEVDVTVYSGTKKGFSETKDLKGIRIVPCYSTDILYPLDNWVFNRSISKMVDKIDADVYEAHAVSGYKFLKKLKKQKPEKPFIQTVHGVLADEYIQSSKSVSPSFRLKLSNVLMRHLGNIEKQAAQQATLVVTVSKYSAQKIVELYEVEETKIRVVPNGVNLERFKPTKESGQAKQLIGVKDEQVVLFVGNLIPRKGLYFLIEAAEQVVKEKKNTKFVVVGNGPLENNLAAYAKQLGLSDNFVFHKNVDDKTLPLVYNLADLFVMPSIQEGQGISMLEAQATAKPVVAFNVTAVNEAVKNNETGILVKPDTTELATTVLKLLSDKELREKMGQAGREFVSKNFSWEICAQKMLQVYSEATETKG